ncbi:8892_t:CDS:1, partial [Funneliformis caledonium]
LDEQNKKIKRVEIKIECITRDNIKKEFGEINLYDVVRLSNPEEMLLSEKREACEINKSRICFVKSCL